MDGAQRTPYEDRQEKQVETRQEKAFFGSQKDFKIKFSLKDLLGGRRGE